MRSDPITRLIDDANLEVYRTRFKKAQATHKRAQAERDAGNHPALLEATKELADLLYELSTDAQLRYVRHGWPPDQTAGDYTRDTSRFLQAAIWAYERFSAVERPIVALHVLEQALTAVHSTLRAARYAIEGTE